MSVALATCTAGAALSCGALFAAMAAGRAPRTPGASVTTPLAAPVRWLLRTAEGLCALVPVRSPRAVAHRLERALARAGLREECAPDAWVAALLFSALLGAGVAAAVLPWAGVSPGVVLLAAGAAPAALQSQLRQRARSRASLIAKELPAGIDLLVLCLESGASLGAAMRIASEKQGAGPVQQLWGDVLAQVRSGLPRAAALRRVMERLDLAPVTALFTALIQAELRGMSLGAALRAQSAQCVADRFVRAERAALQAPVKLLLPLLTCIFPCTFIVIAIPIAARFIGVGGP